MNWKLIFGLSFLELVIILGLAYFIPSSSAPILAIYVGFVFLAYLVAKYAPGKYFLHGFCIMLVNCIWVAGVRILLFIPNIAQHVQEMGMSNKRAFFQGYTRLQMMAISFIWLIISGIILGLFCFIASKLVKKKVPKNAF